MNLDTELFKILKMLLFIPIRVRISRSVQNQYQEYQKFSEILNAETHHLYYDYLREMILKSSLTRTMILISSNTRVSSPIVFGDSIRTDNRYSYKDL